MSNGPEKTTDNLDMAFSSSVEQYAQRLQQTLDQVLIELEKGKNFNQLAQGIQNALLWCVSGGSQEVVQCKAETVTGISDSFSRIRAALEKDESVIYKLLINVRLQKFLDDLNK